MALGWRKKKLSVNLENFQYSKKESGETSSSESTNGNELLLSNATIGIKHYWIHLPYHQISEEGDIESGEGKQTGQKASGGQTFVESGQKVDFIELSDPKFRNYSDFFFNRINLLEKRVKKGEAGKEEKNETVGFS